MTKQERSLAQKVIRRSRRVLELRRQLSKAERELATATDQLERVTLHDPSSTQTSPTVAH
jgi:hypothetical protein